MVSYLMTSRCGKTPQRKKSPHFGACEMNCRPHWAEQALRSRPRQSHHIDGARDERASTRAKGRRPHCRKQNQRALHLQETMAISGKPTPEDGEEVGITRQFSHIRSRRACCRCRPWGRQSNWRI